MIAHFELKELLGRGGQGEVYQAVDRQLGRVVALKLLHRAGAGEDHCRIRASTAHSLHRAGAGEEPHDGLLAEARRQAALNHLSLPTIYEVGQWGDRCYLAMEYVTGEVLARRLAAGPLETETAVSIAVQVAGALQAVHEAGYIHGDLSGANVMLLPGGGVKVLDLGLAQPLPTCPAGQPSAGGLVTSENPSGEGKENLRLSAPNHTRHRPDGTRAYKEDSASDTVSANGQEIAAVTFPPNGSPPGSATAVLSGTAPYLAPEVLRREGRDRRSDVFALGALLYEMVTGRHPFARAGAEATFVAILQEEPPPLSQSRPEAPLELERIVRRALAKQPAERYPTAADFCKDLEALLRRLESAPVRPKSIGVPPPIQQVAGTAQPSVRAWLRLQALVHRRHRILLTAGVTAAVSAAAGWVFGHPLGAEWVGVVFLLLVAGACLAASALARRGLPPALPQLSAGRAFQGLLPFVERDRDRFFGRQAETEALLKMVTAPELRFAVVVGESGCGKTSLLRAALVPRLWEAGYLPVYCRAYTDLPAAIGVETQRQCQIARQQDEPLGDYLRRVSQALKTTVVIVCDQFEEFFVNFPAEAEREPFLSFVATVAGDPRARVKSLLSIRSDFLHLVSSEFTGRIDEPLASRRLFHLRNFTQIQAEEVIRRSAAQAGLPLEGGFSSYLARDLGAGRAVLPSELQIVGEQLQSQRILTVADYRRAGGKEQLVNRFLADVIQLSGAPAKAARVLHALVSEENTRLTLPLEEVARRAQLGGETVKWLLQLFVQGRLVREIQEGCPWRYELVHEYLIGPIHRTTGKVMDERQRADRLLRQYLANYQGDPKTRVPLGKLFFLLRFSGAARRGTGAELMRKSAWRAGWQVCVGGLLALAAALTLAAALSVSETWERVTLRDGHTAAALQAVFSPDGARLVTSSADGTVIVWDFPRRRRLAAFHDHTGGVWSVAFSPDGRFLATGSHDGTVVIRDGATLEKITTLLGDDWVINVAFVPAKPLLVVFKRKTTAVWSTNDWRKKQEYLLEFSDYNNSILMRSGNLAYWNGVFRVNGESLGPSPDLKTWGDPENWGNWFALSPDGARLASINGDGVVRCWRVGTSRCLLQKKTHHDHGRAVAFSPDGRWLASGAENIALWDAATLTLVCRLDYPAIVWNLAFSLDSRWLVSAHGDGAVLLWDLQERALAARLDQHSGPVRAVAFSSDGRQIASAGDDHSVILWDVAGTPRKSETLLGHATRVNGVAFSPDGSWLVSCDQMGRVLRWDLARPQVPDLRYTQQGSGSLYTIEVIEGGRNVVVDGKVLDSVTGRQVLDVGSVIGASPQYYDYSWCAKVHMLAGVSPRHFPSASIWEIDTSSGRCLGKNSEPDIGWICVSLAPDGGTLVTGNDNGEVWLWQARPLRRLALLGKHAARVKAVSFSPDGRHVASAGDDCTIKLWDSRRRRLVTQIDTHTAPVLALAFSPDGKRLVSGEHDHSVRLYTLNRSLWGFPLD